jgi:hypothetical protein
MLSPIENGGRLESQDSEHFDSVHMMDKPAVYERSRERASHLRKEMQMKRAVVVVLLVMVILTVASSLALAKGGEKKDWVCWTNLDGDEQEGWYLKTASGIVQQWKADRHGVFKPASKFDMSGEDGWTLWTAKAYPDCAVPSDVSIDKYLVPGQLYWYKFNFH